ncbi:cysteine--tRNA ligase [Candidatus Daviesbacteria bacterium RIFCSPLOWO2_01_FULL_39_12]|uniref:Cysteine--tRNA ligase n=1 Tax=Candidatus Daviesbacteria bacterium RIFCSPLOWO2_01_FULL_39_12 TaxID=1797785 RepID=A0A1F5KSX5_9BACT|nr:MAG: cysteine--tRNA ligase [Candidatus Daviesbacteria bacterium RIFCSPHIGHO2_02_FULL_39_8]OGE44028.1 MAG: cysteine--tRNA ligase [Candidatus Daviesbacteria bacterium RIFCSPLOWO2_01_FULL_39_12]
MQLYNSLTRKIEPFKTLQEGIVTMYVCGITPYDITHLGHAFTYVFFDVLLRYLKFKGYKVTYVQNITDIDDDILKKAKEVKKNWQDLGNFWTKRYLQDMHSLNVLPPTRLIKATDSIDKIIQIIKSLLKKGAAYQRNGNIYFQIKKFPTYGKLSRCNRREMLILSQERGGNPQDPLKIDPLDFILWQESKKDEPSWNSPWGKGRPGWHIECSAMIHQYLGSKRSRTIDIHGGGRDLIYPHHESEIAQSESYTVESPFVNFWMHTCMVLFQGEKMAKSLGNLIMVKDLLKKYSPNTIRWLLLSHRYRSPWEFTQDNLGQIENKVKLIETTIRLRESAKVKEDGDNLKKFQAIMEEDLNTPKALDFLLKLARKKSAKDLKKLYSLLGFRKDFQL